MNRGYPAVASVDVTHGDDRPVCSRCGTRADDDTDLPSGWSLVTDERGMHHVCATCTRANVRSIEAKLPEEWWE
jgi:DNA-directed RNA polymerase subunit RPC12/RpoP